jgi:hypothetical protein
MSDLRELDETLGLLRRDLEREAEWYKKLSSRGECVVAPYKADETARLLRRALTAIMALRAGAG